jgi:hypothetical protein
MRCIHCGEDLDNFGLEDETMMTIWRSCIAVGRAYDVGVHNRTNVHLCAWSQGA